MYIWHNVDYRLKQYHDQINGIGSRSASQISIANLISEGFLLISLSEQADNMTGTISIILFLVHLVIACCGIFFGTVIFSGFKPGRVDSALAHSCLLTSNSIFKYMTIFCSGYY
jgi:hypothetical protein